MHGFDSLQLDVHERMQRRLDEAAHEALLAALPHRRSPRLPRNATLTLVSATRRSLADSLRALARRLDPQTAAYPERRVGTARPQ